MMLLPPHPLQGSTLSLNGEGNAYLDIYTLYLKGEGGHSPGEGWNRWKENLKGTAMSETREQVRAYIVDNFLFGDDNGLEDSTSFLESGMIDSTGILEVISFLEEQFAIKVHDDELIPENLDSIGNIVGFLGGKLAAA